MAVTISTYNHTRKLFLNKEVTFTTLKAMLLDNTASFTASHTTIDSVAGAASPHRAKEVYGNGWTEGGTTLASVAVTQVNTNQAMLDAADVDVTASGGTIGPAYVALVYDSTLSKPLFYADFGQAQDAGDTTDFKIIWSANGLAIVS